MRANCQDAALRIGLDRNQHIARLRSDDSVGASADHLTAIDGLKIAAVPHVLIAVGAGL